MENNGVFSHIYIGINGGVNQTTVSNYHNWDNGFMDGLKSLTYNAGIEIGKDITPITSFSLQANVSPIYRFNKNEDGLFVNSGEWKAERTDLYGNVKFNLMNLFGGYKGYPRRVEIKTVTGIGWNHNFNEYNPNDFGLQAGLEFDFNLGKNRNWFITFSPMVQANNLLKGTVEGGHGPDEMLTAAKGADLKANIGIAYRLGHGNESHNFEICPYTYTDKQFEDLYALYDECMNRPAEVDTVVVEKTVEVEKIVKEESDNDALNFVPFTKGKAVIEGLGQEMFDNIAHKLSKDAVVEVIGSADSSTGSAEFNVRLAEERANAVAKALREYGIDNVTVKTAIDALETSEMSRCAIIIKK